MVQREKTGQRKGMNNTATGMLEENPTSVLPSNLKKLGDGERRGRKKGVQRVRNERSF